MSAHFASAVPIPAIISRPLEPDLWRLTLLYRMITGGEDALYIARRLVVVASEDVGLADNHALPLVSLACEIGADGGKGGGENGELVSWLTPQAMATYQACQVIGLPECRINLAVG